MQITKTVSLAVNIVGSVTQEKYEGIFETKIFLSHKDTLREDEFRRTHLGRNSSEASEYAKSIASALAFLNVRITKSPEWFVAQGYGADIVDDNVLIEVHNAISKAIADEITAIAERGKEAKAALEKVVSPPSQI